MDELQGTDLRKYLQILRRRWPLILLVMVFTGTGAYLLSARMTPVYRGATQLQIQPFTNGSSQSQDLLNLFQNPTLVLETDVKLIESDAVLNPVVSVLKLPSVKRLKQALSVKLVPNTQILEIDVDTHVPVQSRDWANKIAESFIIFQRTQSIERITASNAEAIDRVTASNTDLAKRLEALKTQIKAAESSPVSGTVIAGLTAQQTALSSALQTVPSAATLGTGGPSVIVPATTPTLSVSPNVRQNVVIGGLLGLFLAGGLVVLGEALDDRLRSGEEVEERSGVPALGSVPFARELAGKDASPAIVHDPSSAVAEAYRTVRTNLRFLSIERPIKSLLVTSSVKGEGKSTTAANLAAAFALSGVRTILVSADLRRPTVHKFFGLPNSEGLVDALLPAARLEALLQRNELPDFRLLAAGRTPPNPTEILSSSRFGDILSALEAASDLVIIDSTPLLGVADASALASRVDGVLLVVNPKEVNRRTFVHANEQLRKAGGHVLGTIMNAVSPGLGYGYGYDYDYYNYYAAEKDKRESRKRRARHSHSRGGALKAGAIAGELGEKEGKAGRTGNGGTWSEEAAHGPAEGAEVKLAMTWGGEGAPERGGQPGDHPTLQPALRSRTLWNGANSAAVGVPELRIWDQPEDAALRRGIQELPGAATTPVPFERREVPGPEA
jgi:succinoglycan biosynthesis transport protein ExoP